ncbi:hypothetical protein INS49_014907 [Diaporthe citri]|uniref:uncharacterized protein n=1 Tax=Diaporthe citri TaxID=83186 RepID=UPI001C7F9A19|nr:uncharacterized protein INS49_014907 [Diaporthe citri]KAG6357031.1 hypothetical protein INS49_014907 [Diaporthe citri]
MVREIFSPHNQDHISIDSWACAAFENRITGAPDELAGRKRRISGPVAAAPAESKGNASSNIRSSAEEFTVTVATKADPALWDCAKRTSKRALETETNPERRRNIEACLEYVMESGYPQIDEVFIAMDGAVEHLTMDGFCQGVLQ